MRRARTANSRRGAITVLTAFVLIAMLAITAFLISLSYIELTRTELQSATDAAARSAVITLMTSQSEEAGRAAAMDIASRHRVGGQPFALDSGDIEFGNASREADGSFRFIGGGHPRNAARALGKKTQQSTAGPAALPFGQIIGHDQFETQLPATAMRLDYDICLVLDRSGSMAWDLSSLRFSYPGETENRPLLENYFSPPHPEESRWAILSDSVAEFLDILQERDLSARVGLVTFASEYTFGQYDSQLVTLDSDLTEDFDALSSAAESVGHKPLIGATNITAGLEEAESLLLTSSQARRRTAHPTIVLFSDGIYTEGGNPVGIAGSLYQNHGIVIHSVTFGAEVEARQTMDDVAGVAGGGLSLHADDASELVQSFRAIANALPVLVTE